MNPALACFLILIGGSVLLGWIATKIKWDKLFYQPIDRNKN